MRRHGRRWRCANGKRGGWKFVIGASGWGSKKSRSRRPNPSRKANPYHRTGRHRRRAATPGERVTRRCGRGPRKPGRWRAVEMPECGKRGNPKAGFPRFPRLLGNLAQNARFPHSHRSDDCFCFRQQRPQQGIGKSGPWKSGNPKAGFPLFHRPERLRQQGRTSPTNKIIRLSSTARKGDTSIGVRMGTFLMGLDKPDKRP